MIELPTIGEIKDIDVQARNYAPGLFVQLSAGQTHYEISGPEDGKLVVLIHGIAGPMGIWDHLAGSLSGVGFRVLQYDLYGRGYSDRPGTRHDIDFFRTQLEELLSSVYASSKVALVGWSLGAIVAAAYTVSHHDQVDRLVLIAPAGIHVSLPAISSIGMVPILGEVLMSVFGRRIVTGSLARGLYNQDQEEDLRSLVTDQMKYRGYLRGFLSTLRNCGRIDASETYRRAGEGDLPVLMISGSHDPSIPGSVEERMRELIPVVEHHTINKAGHYPHFEQPTEVDARILEFLG